jgi:pimeloyl-ACP methyl ester carboxylesterase
MAHRTVGRLAKAGAKASSPLQHRQLRIEGLSIHVVDGGAADKPAVVFLHGWPQSWAAFEPVMLRLSREARVVAIDLPGIGESTTPPPSNDKRTLAKYVRALLRRLDLHQTTLVGHDIGGQIAYAFLRAYPTELHRVVLMNIAIPGVEPWSEIERNPYIWHFRFHAVPGLPERLVAGREAPYFDYFFDRISAKPGAIARTARKTYVQAYARRAALHAGFEWYRAFPQDRKDNLAAEKTTVNTPVLYLRGEKDSGLDLDRYVNGLRDAGLRDVKGGVVAKSGHFVADEQPNQLLNVLRQFLGLAA